MTRYIAFLRGINVGGHRVSMERLRELFTKLGFANVGTFIASGNILFDTEDSDTAALEARIEAHLKQSLGYEVSTFLRTLDEVTAAIAFAETEVEREGYSLHVGFMRDTVQGDDRERIRAFGTEVDEFRVQGRELYWLCRGKVTESLVSWTKFDKGVKLPVTMRNVTSLRKLVAKKRDSL